MLRMSHLREDDQPISIYNVFAHLFGEVISVLRLPMLDLLSENWVLDVEQDHAFRVLRIVWLPSR
jgi:hypothetical protein